MAIPIHALRLHFFRILAPLSLLALVTGNAAAGPISFVYALQQVNGGANQIHGFRFDQTTGALLQLPGFPVPSGGTGSAALNSEHLAYLDGRLYVVNDGNNTLSAFSVNRSTGALTAMPYSPIALGAGEWGCVAVHPSGSPVVVGDGALVSRIASFSVSSLGAVAALGSPYSTGAASPFSCRFSEEGAHVYTGGNVGTQIAGFEVDANTGVLTPLAGSPFNAGAANPGAYATDNSGRFFTAMVNAGTVRAFVTLKGALAPVTGNPFVSGLTTASHGILHPAGFYMVADRSGNRVGVYRIASSGGATTLTAVFGSPFGSGGTFTNALAVPLDGRYLLAANGTSRNMTVFAVNPITGALTPAVIQPTNTLGASGIVSGLAIAPGEADGFVYSLQQGFFAANRIHGFRIDGTTGVLTALPGFPIASGGDGSSQPFVQQLAYRNGRLYVVNTESASLTAFRVNRTTGALTPLPFSPLPLPAFPVWVAAHPSGSPVVVGRFEGGVVSFDVNATTAAAAPGSPFATSGVTPVAGAFSADGSYAYIGGDPFGAIAGFAVNASTGVLTPLAGSPFPSGAADPVGYASDAAGRLFVSNVHGDVRAFTTASGIPTGVANNPFASGLALGVHGIHNPLGYYMVADSGPDQVGVFRVAGTGAATTLTAVAGSPFLTAGSSTGILTQTTDGRLVVAANGESRNLTVFHVNPVTGALSLAMLQPVNTLGTEGLITGLAFAEASPPFLDDPLAAMTSVIRAVHILDLRARIDSVRIQYGLGPYAYGDPTLTVATTVVRAAHVADLRAALAEAYVALGMTAPSYTDPTLNVGLTVVKLAHLMELRAAVLAIE